MKQSPERRSASEETGKALPKRQSRRRRSAEASPKRRSGLGTKAQCYRNEVLIEAAREASPERRSQCSGRTHRSPTSEPSENTAYRSAKRKTIESKKIDLVRNAAGARSDGAPGLTGARFDGARKKRPRRSGGRVVRQGAVAEPETGSPVTPRSPRRRRPSRRAGSAARRARPCPR